MTLQIDIHLRRKAFELAVEADIDRRVAGILGPSGSGKTTLLHAIAGLEPGAVGRVCLDGQTLQDTARRTFVPPHGRRLGVCFQTDRLLPHRSVKGNLEYGYRLTPAKRRRLHPAEVVDLLEIGDLLDRRPDQLSGGQRQRVALGRALLTSPRLLLLDEPLASLDRRLRGQILPFLRRVRDRCEVPMLMVTHDPAELLELTDHVLILQSGRLLGQGSFFELARQEAILPLLHAAGLPNLLRTRLIANRPREGVALCRLQVAEDGYRPEAQPPVVRMPLVDAPAGAEIHAILPAEAVAVALLPAPDISIQNQLPGRVVAIACVAGRSVCEVDIGVRILIEITPRAAELLRLAPGREVWCLFKTQALRPLPV